MSTERPVRLGVTGTDTEIGKTVVSCALASLARERGMTRAVMKPIETGVLARTRVDGPSMRSDAERLRAAAAVDDAIDLIRPIALVEPLAPMVAARRAARTLDLSVLDTAFATLSADRDVIVVEGAGGFLVPITRDMHYGHLFARWQCDLVIVAGNRLGVLNHTLLTVQAAESLGLRVRAIVLTSLTGRDATVAEATNFDALVSLLPHIRCYRFPWVDRWEDPDALAAAAAGAGLAELLVPDAPPHA
ncbi:MAG TPA: dethiobiotin synthase [Gemmatimonadaceae bacterium]|nr:dethiobiotin synthase [Gemmatimonadaceae bacterium]